MAEKALPTSQKYQTTGTKKKYAGGDFQNDSLDQRSWTKWCTEWLGGCRALTRVGAYLLVFVDWRQLPAMTDAVQMSGWTWRGVIPWDKTECSRAPHKGYFRHQAEYVVWGSNGSLPAATHAGPFPGVYRERVKHQEKHHVTGKPIPLLREILKCVPPGSRVLDPFAGSSSTLLAARENGLKSVGIELSAECCQVSCERLLK
jgi:site-specific DNA-methyltransferase (adenine-specific)